MTAGKHVVVLSPGLDQSKAIAETLRRSDPAVRIVGAYMPGEVRVPFQSLFDELRPIEEGVVPDGARAIPTGALATEFMLERGDVSIGSVTMTRDALRFYDKPWSLRTAEAAGVPVPTTWYQAEEIQSFPLFFKSTTEGGGRRGIAHGPDELPVGDDGLIYQELIDTPGTYGVAILARGGEILAAHVHHEIESYPESGGSAVVVEQFFDARLRGYAERLVRDSGFSGWGLVEFKYCPRRADFVFMELNAKFWASSEFAFRNEPLFTQLLFGVDPVGAPCRRMVFMHRAFQRGAAFLFGTLPALSRRGTLRFVPGAWQWPAIRMFVPAPVLAGLRRMRR